MLKFILNPKLFISLMICLFLVKSVNAEEQLEQYFLPFPPFWIKNEDNSVSGLHYRLAQAVYLHAGLNVKLRSVPYLRMKTQIELGKVPFINYGEDAGVKTEDIVHICIPPTRVTLRAYYIKDDLGAVKSEKDFEGKKVIIVRGLPLGGYEPLKQNKNITLNEANSPSSGLKMLLIERGDYLVTFDNTVEFLKKNEFKEHADKFKDEMLFTLRGYPIVSPKTYPGGAELCKKVTESYHQLVKEGIINDEYKLLTSDLQYLDDLTRLP